MLVSAADYHRSGGHATVKREVLEDVALARVMSAQSIPVTNYVGRETLRFRMYGGGIGDVVTGWTKNFARGAIATGPVLILLIAGWITGSGIAARFPVEAAIVAGRAAVGSGADLAVVAAIRQEAPDLLVGVAAYAAYVLQIRWLLRRIGNFGILTALFYPVPLAFFTAVFLRSLYRTLVRKSVTWKGREIQITSSDAPTDTGAGPGDEP
jgi:4,4'-diaponeurosporenoate glycosyltransferase